LFKPPVGFSTQSVYDDLAKKKKYSQRNFVHDHLNAWETGEIMNEQLLSNDLEAPVFLKHPYIPELFRILVDKFNLQPMLSGSGSCCFCLASENTSWDEIITVIRDAWGEEAFVQSACFI
jgi:4-diphosphocytidyl-2C-methyl-D-erythritol kinase